MKKEKKDVKKDIYYQKPLHLQNVNKDLNYSIGDMPIAEKISNTIFSIPMHPYLKVEQINRISDIIINNVRKN